jgi:threonine synthase
MALSINPYVERLACSRTGEEVDHDGFSHPIGLSPAGFPVVVEYDLEAIAANAGDDLFEDRQGMWRYSKLLPVWGVPEAYGADVGGTPTVPYPALSERYGVDLWVKHEGGNPTGSFKDRGLAVGVALGRALGAESFFLPTQGNAGVAASLFSTRLGLPACRVTMPEDYVGGMYHKACAHYGGKVSFFGPNIAAAGKFAREEMAEEVAAGRSVDLSTFFEPGRLEGKKTMGLEIYERFGEDLPDWVIYPTGGGTGLVGIWKAFEELKQLGLIAADKPMPKMVAVQSTNCAPVVESFLAGDELVSPVTSQGTIADGLDVPGAIMGHEMLRVLYDSGGQGIAVTEQESEAAYIEFAAEGAASGYEGSATLAAMKNLLDAGSIVAGEKVLLLNTNSPWVALSKTLG